MALSRIAGICASAMATSAQTMTRTNSAIVPMNLRSRSGMRRATQVRCERWPQHYMVRARPTSEPMTEAITTDTHARAIRLWLYAVAALVLAMVLVGGATRLTESGLSITEWKPVMGVLPPLGERQWQAAFEKYQAIPQYRELNRRHEPCRVQDDFLVGMDAPAPRPA